ncbi:MAG: glutamate--tRNA ligase [Thermoplasmatales archaeon]|nr:glutamate--tRNA ligase [Thermoplasmatales archaeon]
MTDDGLRSLARKYALQNAVFFDGKANPKAVVGKILGECPEYRSRAKEVAEVAGSVVAEVNAIGLDAQRAELEASDPSLLVREKKEKTHDLPDLDGAEGGVVMRIAPGPSGPLHIGHTRVSILNDEYVKRYGGRLICRYEDTDPDRVDPDAYEMIREDMEWLGVDVTDEYIQSDRFQEYYDVTRRLISDGNAYVCLCDADDWRALKEEKKACPCRDRPVEENLELYERFLGGEFADGKAVAVVKTDVAHPNPAVRDFVALRLVRTPHPRTGTKYVAYPMMNLSVAVDDHLMGMTHVIRGKDHLNNTHRQEYVYDYMGWEKPRFYHYGLVNIPDTLLKTSLIRKGIADGEYSGWDDVRTGTVRALRKRGFRPEAIRRYWVEGGMKQIDVQFSWDTLYSMNRDIIDDVSNRYFFVRDPVRYDIDGVDSLAGEAPLHLDHPERGVREYAIGGRGKTIFISAEDSAVFAEDGAIRLKDLCNLEYGTPAKYAGNDLSVIKGGMRVVQWVSRDSVEAEVLMPDGTVARGLVENAILRETGETVQFERFGFARIESMGDGPVRAVFTHR